MNSPLRPRFRIWVLMALLTAAFSAGAGSLPDFTELVKQAGPAVVNISTVQKPVSSRGETHPFRGIPGLPDELNELFRRYLEQQQGDTPHDDNPKGFDAESLGSGFIISSDGLILTNHHVIEGADQVIVRLHDRRELDAEVIGSDPRSDIALIKIDAGELPTARIGSSADIEVGEWVLAIGTPFGFERSATVGIISALGRNLPSGNYVPFIQTDVAINPGNSGGPLFNLDGEVVGVNSQIYSRTGGYMGLSFAIPIDIAMEVVQQLRDSGHVTRGYLGVLIQDVDRDLAESFGMDKPEGALVSRVMADGPAERAGLRVGDIIIRFNGRTVISSAALPPMVGRIPVGDTATIEVIRNGKHIELQASLAELPDTIGLAGARKPAKQRDGRLGLSVSTLDDKQREEAQIGDGGVWVRKVTPGSAAARAGVEPGDIVLLLNQRTVTDVRQFKRLVKGLPGGKSVPLLVQRGDGPLFLPLRVPK